MSKKLNLSRPVQIVNTPEGLKKYYIGIPETLAPSTFSNNKDVLSKTAKQGMKDKKSTRTYNIKNEGLLPGRKQF